MPEAVIELAQYYYAASAGTLVGLDVATSEIIRIRPTADVLVELDTTRTVVVGRFLHFDNVARILRTESGLEIHLPITAIEKSRTLKDTTKRWLAQLAFTK